MSRKFSIPLLEYFDKIKLTIQVGLQPESFVQESSFVFFLDAASRLPFMSGGFPFLIAASSQPLPSQASQPAVGRNEMFNCPCCKFFFELAGRSMV